MARELFGATPADYVVDPATGLPKPGVVINMYATAGGTAVTDLLLCSDALFSQGAGATSVTSGALGQYPFWGPDGWRNSLWARTSDGVGGFLWHELFPSGIADIVAGLATVVGALGAIAATPASPTAKYFRGDGTWQTLNADAVPDGTTNHAFTAADDTKLAGVATGATANFTDAWLLDRGHHTGAQATSTVTGLDAALGARVVNAGGFGRVWGRTSIQGFPQGSDGALDGDWLAMDEN